MDESKTLFEIRFEGLALSLAGINAQKLRQDMLRIAGVSANIVKDSSSTQDAGATLVLILGTPAVVAVAAGLAAYLKRNNAKISISADGDVVATGISGSDAAKIAEAFSKKIRAKS